ncbi:hypothetical protein SAMN05216296_2420 [Pseudomonas pohangensis]|uniref:Uncharacterized protein n=1 Tax=Pseudomonas pohangensis TaxID=364197 RepID=A0A1H2GNQ5_9PSED|nr:hypothetical protein [Pseudomonas pohangensis]SDU21099.1 hypothetical protein SAMN05216296_2420 [Pseudomonas pohangensis]
MNEELIVNLWAIFDGSTGFIYGLAGKVYKASGTESQKLDILKSLAATDYATAKRYKLPDRFVVDHIGVGSVSGLAPLDAVFMPSAGLFESIFQNLEQELPPMPSFSGEGCTQIRQVIPQDPLCVTTVLYEDEVGNIRAIISDEDREWVMQQEDRIHGSDAR